ncbi:MAG UNVERIFIED_CONTAM: FAD-binding protein [Anaerolineae bacterium]
MVLDLSKYMNRVLELNATKRWVWVEAGAIQAHVNNMASQHGLKIGPDPSSTRMASVGHDRQQLHWGTFHPVRDDC